MNRLIPVSLALCLMSFPFAALAQATDGSATAQPADADTPARRSELPATPAPRPDSGGDAAPLRGISAPFKALDDAGILIDSDFYGDFQANPVGGLQHGAANAGAETLGADADLATLVGVRGGRFHLLFTYEYGDTLQKNGSTTFVKRHQYNIEANYGFQLVPGVTVTPNAEYIVNPDITQRPDAQARNADCLALIEVMLPKLDVPTLLAEVSHAIAAKDAA